jgi:hypothetical protein
MATVILRILGFLILSKTGFTKAQPVNECSAGLFQCGEEIAPRAWCISRAWVCDGEKDCPDGSDEEQDCRKFRGVYYEQLIVKNND